MKNIQSHEKHIGYLIKRVQHEIRKKIDIGLKKINLTTAQYRALSHLEDFPGLSNADLARKSFLTPQTMNQIIIILEKRKFISRNCHQQNNRIQQIHLTGTGKSTLNEAHRIVSDVEETLFKDLTEKERVNLVRYLQKIKIE